MIATHKMAQNSITIFNCSSNYYYLLLRWIWLSIGDVSFSSFLHSLIFRLGEFSQIIDTLNFSRLMICGFSYVKTTTRYAVSCAHRCAHRCAVEKENPCRLSSHREKVSKPRQANHLEKMSYVKSQNKIKRLSMPLASTKLYKLCQFCKECKLQCKYKTRRIRQWMLRL